MSEEKDNKALGGQHSGGEWRCEDCGAQADEWFDCCKNPARAEAQDEGAAGEPVAWLVQGEGKRDRLVNARQYNPTKLDYWISAEAMAEHTITPLYAHPSPTPAADADRVRIAVEAFNAKINAPLTGPTHGAWDRGRIAGLKEGLAALKSTAAKEGEKE